MKLTFWDKFFIAFVLMLSVTGFILNFSLDAVTEQQYITVQVDNNFVMEFSFTRETEKKIEFPFGEEDTHTATLEISQGKVRMLPMTKELCPRGICSQIGWIERNYQSIACVPNRIIVSFRETQLHDDVDGITY